jgi:hypothetical protein
MEEIWKDIIGYFGLYQISNLGNIKSLERYRYNNLKYLQKEKHLSLIKNVYGYLQVNLCKYGKIKIFKVHRLVACAFISNPENKPEINHKNGIKIDNRVENLEWCTRSENEIHSYENGFQNQKGEKNNNVKLTQIQVNQIRSKYIPYKYSSFKLADEYNISQQNIINIINKKIWN